jgi:c-di-GMP-binding flagellar brake protein YcgR
MTNIIEIFYKLFTRRRDQRFTVFSDTFVTLSPAITPGRERKVRIVDISESGAVFIYNSSTESENVGFLKLFDAGPDSGKIRFETVSDVQVSGASQTEDSCWRKSVKFTWMADVGQSELKKFLKEFSLSQK